MKIFENYSLINENTFHLDVKAKYFAIITSVDELKDLINNNLYKEVNKLFIGQGANILFTKDFDGLVIKNEILGIETLEYNKKNSLVSVGSGENWHDFVMYSVDNNLGGIENLALIPGTVGAAPVQNIAAYGQNMSDVFHSLIAINTETGEERTFSKEECSFKYRDSFFKSVEGKKYFVYEIIFKLSTNSEVNTSYFEIGNTYTQKGSLLQELESVSKPPYSLRNVADAVIRIRQKKLPDVLVYGNAGSFFKNPVITKEKYNKMIKTDPDLQCYPVDKLTYPKLDDPKLNAEDYVKIPGGRLLDNLGWKGKRVGNVGTYKNQAMAIINYGGAKPEEIVNLYKNIQDDVLKNYGIKLEPEVNII